MLMKLFDRGQYTAMDGRKITFAVVTLLRGPKKAFGRGAARLEVQWADDGFVRIACLGWYLCRRSKLAFIAPGKWVLSARRPKMSVALTPKSV